MSCSMSGLFFVSNRSGPPSCASATGVQTCALPVGGAFFTERHPTQLGAPDDGSLVGADGAAVLEAAEGSGRLDILVGSTGSVDATGEPIEGGMFGAAVEDIERRIAEGEQQALALATTMDIVAGAPRVKFPRDRKSGR